MYGFKCKVEKIEMVMHGQVADFMDVLFGEASECPTSGEISFVVPRHREFDQELEDFSDLIETDELSLIPTMDQLLDDECQVAETVIIATEPEDQGTVPSTSGSSHPGSSQPETNYFKFPSTNEALDSSDFMSTMTEASYLEDVIDDDPAYLSCSSSQYSPGTVPPTPSTASSTDSASSHIPTFLKRGLKMSIQARRMQEGKGELKVEFRSPEPENLTPEEEELRRLRREKNKLAAQKCRSKKKQRADVLEEETKKLEGTQDELKTEIQKLVEERDHLMDLINVHKAVCPKIRAVSSSF